MEKTSVASAMYRIERGFIGTLASIVSGKIVNRNQQMENIPAGTR